jgi:phosphoglycerol transferase MdoB-like AlkP superfamily enzyme
MKNPGRDPKEFVDVYIFIFILFIKLISLNYNIGLKNLYSRPLVFGCLGSILIALSIPIMLKASVRIWILLGIDLLFSLLFMTDLVYNRYFQDVTSAALLKLAGLTGEVGNSVTALIHWFDFLYFIDIAVLVPLYILYWRKRTRGCELSFRLRSLSSICLLAMGFLMSWSSTSSLEKDQPGLLKTFYDKKYIVGSIGDLNFHALDLYKYIGSNYFLKASLPEGREEEIRNWFAVKNTPANGEHKGIAAGKNLIVVQLEAFQQFVFGRSINNSEITPNLNNISRECLVFDNFFYQTAWGGTSDAELLTNVSLLPAREGSAFYQYASNTYDSLPGRLKSMGYYTSVMHANRPGFWNRAQMYRNLGFDAFESEGSFILDETRGLGLSDRSFFRQTIEKMKSYPKPFYSMLITLSSHFPFNSKDDILDTGIFEDEFLGDYLEAVRYTDGAMGEFVGLMKKNGLWDNSIVVFYGDHSAVPFEKRGQLAQFLYGRQDLTAYEWSSAQKVVAMIHFPGNTITGNNGITSGQLDLYPTIANLFGFEAPFTLGRDLLNSRDGFIVTRDGMWGDNGSLYLKSIDRVVDIKCGKELNKEDFSAQFKEAFRLLVYSDAVLEHNLVQKWKLKGY